MENLLTNLETFQPVGEVKKEVTRSGVIFMIQRGTVEVKVGHQIKVVETEKIVTDGGEPWFLHEGFVAKYKTGSKYWKVSFTVRKHNNEYIEQVSFGRDERVGRCHKMQGVIYNPEIYKAI